MKNFLHYAECASRGELRAARGILGGLNPLARKALASSGGKDTVISQLAAALRGRGFTVDEHVGQSRFRCDLAIRANDGHHYCLGITIDTASWYENPDVLERCVTRPGILGAFGWQAALILTRDWYHDPQGVLDRIQRLLLGEVEPGIEVENDLPSNIENGTPAENPPGATRRFEFSEGHSSKFWEITQSGCSIVVRYGRIGTHGQTLNKVFDDVGRTTRESEKLIAEKVRKGYHECLNI